MQEKRETTQQIKRVLTTLKKATIKVLEFTLRFISLNIGQPWFWFVIGVMVGAWIF